MKYISLPVVPNFLQQPTISFAESGLDSLVAESDYLDLICTVQGTAPVTLVWLKDGSAISSPRASLYASAIPFEPVPPRAHRQVPDFPDEGPSGATSSPTETEITIEPELPVDPQPPPEVAEFASALTLFIEDLVEGDSGVYTCIATNVAGVTSASVDVLVKGQALSCYVVKVIVFCIALIQTTSKHTSPQMHSISPCFPSKHSIMYIMYVSVIAKYLHCLG